MTTEYRIEYRDGSGPEWFPYDTPMDDPGVSFAEATSSPEMDEHCNRLIVEWRLVKVTTEVVRTATRERETA